MRNWPDNIETRKFPGGFYVGYPKSNEGVYRITKRGKRWCASHYIAGIMTGVVFSRPSLADISDALRVS